MTLITRFLVPLALLASVLPFVTAGSSDCQPNEFWYDNDAKGCCVSKTPPSKPPGPPSGKSCPSSDKWDWDDDKSCCLPHTTPPVKTPPTCKEGHEWDDDNSCCSGPKPGSPGHGGDGDCDEDDFWFEPKSCCVPKGGKPNPPSPPTGSECPPTGWYWNTDQKCCIPHQSNPPPPQCPSDWDWNSGNCKCQPKSTPPSPKKPQPSKHSRGWNRAEELRV